MSLQNRRINDWDIEPPLREGQFLVTPVLQLRQAVRTITVLAAACTLVALLTSLPAKSNEAPDEARIKLAQTEIAAEKNAALPKGPPDQAPENPMQPSALMSPACGRRPELLVSAVVHSIMPLMASR